jgi:aldose 1-epimerase
MDRHDEMISIDSGRLTATVIPFGASLTDLRLSDCDHPLVLGYASAVDHRNDNQFMGAVIGRYANRIAHGRFRLDDRTVEIDRNERGECHLHGGGSGFWNRNWSIRDRDDVSVSFALTSPDGEAGYPGTMEVVARYEVVGEATLRLSFEASCDKDTIINICHHPYFNFSGRRSIEDHRLMIEAEKYLPSTPELIPTGEIAGVQETPFDFRSLRPLPEHMFNNTYALHRQQYRPLSRAAVLACRSINMELWTTQPGLHLYNGYKLSGRKAGHLGVPYPPVSGICLEPQAWPDSPNRANFPSPVWRANSLYRQVNEYRFSTA